MLQDCLVSGINDDNMQNKLLSEPTLTHTRALEIAQGTEEAKKNITEMRALRHESDKTGPQATSRQDPIYQIARSGKKSARSGCYCCGPSV